MHRRPVCRAGHKYAGNVVVYGAMHPCDGDVFGGVSAAGAAAFLDALMGVEVRSGCARGRQELPSVLTVAPPRWRP